jgi:predicted O-linked N-acetylglucosamine transferase (SPINDLY family)
MVRDMTAPVEGRDAKSLLAMAYRLYAAGDMTGAANIYNEILTFDPGNSDSMLMMGIISFGAQKFDDSEKWIQAAIDNSPMPNFMAYKVLGDVSRVLGKTDAAVTSFKKSLDINPNYAEACANLASLYLSQNDLAGAEEYCRRALRLKADYPVPLYNLGLILEMKGNFEEARQKYEKAISFKQDMAVAYAGMGRALKGLQNPADALSYFEKAVFLSPVAEVYAHMAEIFQDMDETQKAADYYRLALKYAPGNLNYLNNLGVVYTRLRQYKNASACYKQVLSLNPENPAALNNMAVALRNSGKLDEAILLLKKSLQVRPDHVATISSLLFSMVYSARVSPDEFYETACRYGALLTRDFSPQYKFGNDKRPDRKLRIGYVSADFFFHAVNNFFEPLLFNHDRNKFEIFAYANVQNPDAVTSRLRAGFDCWRDIRGLGPHAAADLIHADRIDILVDMSGHTGDHSLAVFALKPAHLQVSWLGFPATTGIAQMDYRITDIHAEPEGMTEKYNVEKLCRLPEIFACYKPREGTPDVTLRAPFEDNGYVTFGCFNNFAKLSDEVLEVWAQILQKTPESCLLLEIADLEDFRDDVSEKLRAAGLPLGRVILENRKPENQFNLYNSIDIALDPFPCNGGTTSMDALWMGVPFITLAGDYFAARMGVTILTNAGLSELITASKAEYVDKAVFIASSRDELIRLRAGLREKFMASPVMSQSSFAKNMEAAYRTMWEEYCA